MKRIPIIALSLVCLLPLGLPAVSLGEEVTVGAGAAPTENIFAKIKEPMEKSIGLKLNLISSGPVQALKDLDDKKVEAASGGITFGDWMKMMEKEGSPVADPGVYKHRVIGKDIVKLMAHKGVAVKTLSKDQLKAIFTGKVTSWKEVGGPDLPVVVVLGSKIPGTQSVFQKQVMDEEPYLQKTLEATTAADVKEKAQATPGAVGLGPVSLVDATISSPEIPEVGRPITLITRGEPSPGVAKLIDYINGEGKQYISK
ncbi:MAG: substrate-binding domain-containing protein [Syntrophobacteraceae bacterium]|jgi:phosphate transport system substrate-binding protein|nr:substrate-binding domain-containing protein [Syntrophobacteraceae bacterium]